jgi:hypothetical protein
MPADYNPAQGATYGQMAAYLSAHSGLDYNVALNWLHAESSTVRGNPLGLTHRQGGVSVFSHFANYQQALDASIANLRNNPVYARVLAAIRGGSPAAERAAIVASPWAGGNYNHGASFSTAGIPGTASVATSPPPIGVAHGSSGGGAYAPAAAGGQVTILEPNGAQVLAGLFPIPRELIGNNGVECAPGYVKAVVSVGPFQTLQGFTSPESVAGQANACVRGGTVPGDRPSGVPDVAGAIAAIPGQFVGAAAPLIAGVAVLAVVGVLGWSGAKDLLGD